jgi:chromosome segregation ATPase
MNLQAKLNELEKTRDEIQGLSGQIGQMAHTPHYDVNYSAAKIDDWQRQLEKLNEKKDNLLMDIAEFKGSADFIRDLNIKNTTVSNRLNKLYMDLDKTKSQFAMKPGEIAEAIIAGGDPLKLVGEYKALEDRVELITKALESCSLALKILSTLGEDIPYTPAHAQDLPQGQKLDIPQVQTQQQRWT